MDRQDEQLISAYMQGEDTALEILFQRYKSSILNFALRILGNRADAEDVVSDVFVSVFSKKYEIRPGAKFKTWLYKVAYNAAISKIRKRKKMISLWFLKNDAGQYEEWDVPDPGSLAPEELIKQETAAAVRKTIHKLPRMQKEAIVLREYHKLGYAEIADIMECSLENVKILIYRAREALRNELPSFIKGDNDG
ncbi:MAG: sigma-70 family RNA polymerase sigma factor [Candidatus Omnitrophica bacterium]|nr:sigma-70 family RNA polymerase sigma factor [Candidatus Omnitrophota bacterium]